MNVSNRDKTLFIRHRDGGTHALRGKRLAKLLRELHAGRGMPELMQLIDAGYTETLSGTDLSADNLAAALQDEADGKV